MESTFQGILKEQILYWGVWKGEYDKWKSIPNININFFFITGDHFVTFHNLYGLSRGVVRRRAHGSRRNLAYPVVPCMSPIQSQLITRNVFWISLQPDWQVNYDIFNRPIMVCIKILVHKWGARKKDFSAVLQTDLTRPQLFKRWVVLSMG